MFADQMARSDKSELFEKYGIQCHRLSQPLDGPVVFYPKHWWQKTRYLNQTSDGVKFIEEDGGVTFLDPGRLNIQSYQGPEKASQVYLNLDPRTSHNWKFFHLPVKGIFSIDFTYLKRLGLDPIQELALGLHYLKNAIDHCKKSKIEPRDFFEKVLFKFAIGSEFLFEQSKILCFRHLITQIFDQEGIDRNTVRPVIYAESDTDQFTFYEPWMNVLRASTCSAVAQLSGVDYLFLHDHYSWHDLGREDLLKQQARRLALNTSRVLGCESFAGLDQAPQQGCYSIESMALAIFERVSEEFDEIREQSGIWTSLTYSHLLKIGRKNKANSLDRMLDRKIKLSGINEYYDSELSLPPQGVGPNESWFLSETKTRAIEALRWLVQSEKDCLFIDESLNTSLSTNDLIQIRSNLELLGLKTVSDFDQLHGKHDLCLLSWERYIEKDSWPAHLQIFVLESEQVKSEQIRGQAILVRADELIEFLIIFEYIQAYYGV